MKFLEKIFSIKNEYKNNEKIKKFNLLGLKICFVSSILKDPTIFDIDIKKYKGLLNNKSKINTVVLGSSHARDGFVPSLEMFNLANSSQDLYRIYRLYDWLTRNNFSNLRNIVVYYDVFHPGFKLEKTCEAYKCIPYRYLFNIQYNGELNKALSKFEKKARKYFECNSVEARNYCGESLRNVFHDPNTIVSELVAKHLKNNRRSDNQNVYLEKLIAKALSNQHNVYIVLPPYKKEYNDCLPNQNDIFKDLFLLIQKYPKVKLLNYQYCINFNSNDFDDIDHLSISGAEKLTKLIKEEIKKENE